MSAFLNYFFSWYKGQFWPNLLADILWGLVILLATRYLARLLKRQHKQHLDQANRHHKELKDALGLSEATE